MRDNTLLRMFLALSIFVGVTPAVSAVEFEFVVASGDDFAHPHDLVLSPDGNKLYISDVNNHVIRVLDPSTLKTLSVIGKGELSAPHDVAFDRLGRLMVADSGNDRVVIYRLDNNQAQIDMEFDENMSSPEGVTSDEQDNIYVASTGNNMILKFKNGKLLKKVGGRGDGRHEFKRPHDIEIADDGLLYIGDPGNSRIQVFTTALDYKSTVLEKKQPFKEPKYLALNTDGWLFVADQHNNQLRVFDHTRKQVGVVKSAGGKSLNYIEGVEVVGDRMWISDTYNNRIVLFNWKRR